MYYTGRYDVIESPGGANGSWTGAVGILQRKVVSRLSIISVSSHQTTLHPYENN